MKKIILFIIYTTICNNIVAQTAPLPAFEKRSTAIDKTGMIVLGSYAATNMVVSAFSLKNRNRTIDFYHEMNIMWNGFNLALAGFGYLNAGKTKSAHKNLIDVIKHQNKTEKAFLFNAGLDVAYIAGGAYLKERGSNKTDPSKLTGYGNAVMVNGGFLFLFDIVMYAVHNKHGKQLYKFIDQLQITGSGAGITATYTF